MKQLSSLVIPKNKSLNLVTRRSTMIAIPSHPMIPSHQKHSSLLTLLKNLGKILRKLPDLDLHHGISNRTSGMTHMVNPQQMPNNKTNLTSISLPPQIPIHVRVHHFVAGVQIVYIESISTGCRVIKIKQFHPSIIAQNNSCFIVCPHLRYQIVSIHLRGQKCLKDIP